MIFDRNGNELKVGDHVLVHHSSGSTKARIGKAESHQSDEPENELWLSFEGDDDVGLRCMSLEKIEPPGAAW